MLPLLLLLPLVIFLKLRLSIKFIITIFTNVLLGSERRPLSCDVIVIAIRCVQCALWTVSVCLNILSICRYLVFVLCVNLRRTSYAVSVIEFVELFSFLYFVRSVSFPHFDACPDCKIYWRRERWIRIYYFICWWHKHNHTESTHTHQTDQSSYVEFSISLCTNWIVPCTTYNMQYKSIEFNKWQIKICRSLVLNRFAVQFEMKRQSYVDDGRRVRKCRPGNYGDPLSHSSSCQKCSSPTLEFAVRY